MEDALLICRQTQEAKDILLTMKTNFKKGIKASVKFESGHKIHLIGIKGVGMTALAIILAERGVKVSGSDTKEKFFTDAVLKKHKIFFKEKFDAKNISSDVNAVICSTAYYFNGKSMGENPEVASAIKNNLPILTYPQALGILAKDYKAIAIAGSHGKSTTTALLGWVMERAGLDPNVIVGTRVNKWNSNARSGKSKYLIIEADEYREAFLNYQPEITVITSIDFDHPDYFKTRASYYGAFKKLVKNTQKKLIVCGDDIRLQKLAQYGKKIGLKVSTYGFSASNDLVLQQTAVKHLNVFHANNKRFATSFPGKPYVLNSGAVIALAKPLKISPDQVQKGIKSFPGTARRLELVKKTKHHTIFDDYAHHPTAIRLTLEGLRKRYSNQKIIAIFQPHMFSRTKTLLKDFAKSFKDADAVGVMEVYPSARESTGPVGAKQLAAQIKLHHSHVFYLSSFKIAEQFLKKYSHSGNIIVLMGAGNICDLVA